MEKNSLFSACDSIHSRSAYEFCWKKCGGNFFIFSGFVSTVAEFSRSNKRRRNSTYRRLIRNQKARSKNGKKSKWANVNFVTHAWHHTSLKPKQLIRIPNKTATTTPPSQVHVHSQHQQHERKEVLSSGCVKRRKRKKSIKTDHKTFFENE